jgi:hypothetical protein
MNRGATPDPSGSPPRRARMHAHAHGANTLGCRITNECEGILTLICSSSCDQTGTGERFEKIEHFVPLVFGPSPQWRCSSHSRNCFSETNGSCWRVEGPRKGEYEVKTYSRSEVGGRQGGLDSVMAPGSADPFSFDSLPAPRLHLIPTPDHRRETKGNLYEKD